MEDVAVVLALAFATGITSKFADLLNEHGLVWFRGASPLLGVLWGALATLLVLQDLWVCVMWTATVLYWYLRCKLDHFNHAFAGVCVLGAALYLAQTGGLPLAWVGGLTGWLVLSGAGNTYAKRAWPHHPGLQRFLRLRLRYYLGPVVLAVVVGSWMPVVAIGAGMAGTELITVWHAAVQRSGTTRNLWWGVRYFGEDQMVSSTRG